MKKLTFSLLALICTLTFTLSACSAPKTSINVTADGIAIKGYDPVAYFTMSRPVKGNKENMYEWNNARWFFANKEHLAMFRESPDKFAPQYGGY